MPVMSILTPLEQDAYSQPPVFSHMERKRFCAFPSSLLAIADTLRSPTNRVGFLLSCAYFRATKRFFPIQSFHPHDIEFISLRWGLSAQRIDLRQYGKYTLIVISNAFVPFMVLPCLMPKDRKRWGPIFGHWSRPFALCVVAPRASKYLGT